MTNSTENTMADLREIVGRHLHETLHGRTIDQMQAVTPRLPHMLGFTEMGETIKPSDWDDTILSGSHEFWENYDKAVTTDHSAESEVITAINTLSDDGRFKKTYPHGEEAGIAYVEVLHPDQWQFREPSPHILQTSCQECSKPLTTQQRLCCNGNSYHIKVSIECESCGFTGNYKRKLIRQ